MILLEARDVHKAYGSGGPHPVVALAGVSFSASGGEAVGLVGESGSGKSTLIRCMLRLSKPDTGSIAYCGIDISRPRKGELRRFRKDVQLVFQDPFMSLNPRMTVEQLVGEGMAIHGLARTRQERRQRVCSVLDLVGLSQGDLKRYPSSFSGGQRQRIAIGRALAVEPRVLVCDEPVASLDVSVQAQVINLLAEMRDQLGLTLVFVAHDLAVVRHVCSKIVVMRNGAVVETASTQELFTAPQTQYTQELLKAIPVPDPSLARRRVANSIASVETTEMEA